MPMLIVHCGVLPMSEAVPSIGSMHEGAVFAEPIFGLVRRFFETSHSRGAWRGNDLQHRVDGFIDVGTGPALRLDSISKRLQRQLAPSFPLRVRRLPSSSRFRRRRFAGRPRSSWRFRGAAIVDVGAGAQAFEDVEQIAGDGDFAHPDARSHRSRTNSPRRRQTNRRCSWD